MSRYDALEIRGLQLCKYIVATLVCSKLTEHQRKHRPSIKVLPRVLMAEPNHLKHRKMAKIAPDLGE